MTTTRKYLLAILICWSLFIPACLFMLIDENSPIGMGFCYIAVFGLYILIPVFLCHLLKNTIKKSQSKHRKFETENFTKVNPGGAARFTPMHHIYCSNKGPVSWGIIFMTLMILFPIGIFYLIRKVSYEKTLYISNGTILTISGSVMALITLPMVLALATSGGEDRAVVLLISIPVVYLLIGVGMIISGILLKNKGITYEKYITLIAEYEITNLDLMKKEFETSYADVTATLEKMIDAELLPDCYIYHENKELIVPGISKKIALKCGTCMGTTVLYSNDERICAYCGGQL